MKEFFYYGGKVGQIIRGECSPNGWVMYCLRREITPHNWECEPV